MYAGREADREKLLEMPKEMLVELLFMQMRNLWTVDGLYFLGIEEQFGSENASEIDRKVWEVMGKIEARRLKEILGVKGDDIPTIMETLRATSWSLDLEDKQIIVKKDGGMFRNTNCRVQLARERIGLGEFPCRMVRWGYLKNFVKEFNEDVEVECNVCPPGDHPGNLWCEWEFKQKQPP